MNKKLLNKKLSKIATLEKEEHLKIFTKIANETGAEELVRLVSGEMHKQLAKKAKEAGMPEEFNEFNDDLYTDEIIESIVNKINESKIYSLVDLGDTIKAEVVKDQKTKLIAKILDKI